MPAHGFARSRSITARKTTTVASGEGRQATRETGARGRQPARLR